MCSHTYVQAIPGRRPQIHCDGALEWSLKWTWRSNVVNDVRTLVRTLLKSINARFQILIPYRPPRSNAAEGYAQRSNAVDRWWRLNACERVSEDAALISLVTCVRCCSTAFAVDITITVRNYWAALTAPVISHVHWSPAQTAFSYLNDGHLPCHNSRVWQLVVWCPLKLTTPRADGGLPRRLAKDVTSLHAAYYILHWRFVRSLARTRSRDIGLFPINHFNLDTHWCSPPVPAPPNNNDISITGKTPVSANR